MSEIELKFEVTPDDLERLSGHPAMAGPGERASLATVYFDTADGDLRAAGLSLRVRRKGGRFTQTLKRTHSADLFDRDEWEAETSRFAPDLSLLEHTPVADLLAQHAMDLSARFTLKVNRHIHLWDEGQAVIEICIDRGEIRSGERAQPFLELELELISGPVERLYEFAKELSQIAPIRLSFDTKGDRGYRLASGAIGDARKAEALALKSDMSAEAAFRSIARSCLVQLTGNGQAMHLSRRPEALHQARIALRRLRSALTIFKPILRDEAFPAVRADLKWTAGELDLTRELDVFIQRLAERPASESLENLIARLRQVRDGAYDRGLAALDSPRFAALLLDTALWVETGPWTIGDDPERAALRDEAIDHFAARVLAHRRRRVRKAGRGIGRLDADHRHRLRIEAKKLRYAAEFFENAFPHAHRRRRRFIEALKGLQDELGALNDIAMAEETARHGVYGRGAVDLAFTAGELVGELKAEEPHLLERAETAFDEFRKTRGFW
ncbi:MAG TPA: CHAD domain-containing protein [Caulobacteraceae bacterium]|nr:CHAD domain-containing protein [Caulobacteraceae bacterium]